MTPEEIAAKLTPAQKRALLWLPADGEPRDWFVGHFDGHKDLRGMSLASGKIDRGRGVMMRWATPLGQQVRAIVAAEEQPEPPRDG